MVGQSVGVQPQWVPSFDGVGHSGQYHGYYAQDGGFYPASPVPGYGGGAGVPVEHGYGGEYWNGGYEYGKPATDDFLFSQRRSYGDYGMYNAPVGVVRGGYGQGFNRKPVEYGDSIVSKRGHSSPSLGARLGGLPKRGQFADRIQAHRQQRKNARFNEDVCCGVFVDFRDRRGLVVEGMVIGLVGLSGLLFDLVCLRSLGIRRIITIIVLRILLDIILSSVKISMVLDLYNKS